MGLSILFLACACGVTFGANAQFNGYWDITVHDEKHPRAWWLKIEGADTATPKGAFISAFAGDLNQIEEISIDGNELVFGFRPKGNATEPGPLHLAYPPRPPPDHLDATFPASRGNPPPAPL